MEQYRKTGDLSSASASKAKEADLLEGLRIRQEWAYRELIERWSDKIYRVAWRFLRRREEAEEIVQEVLEKVVEKIDTFQANASLYTWLYRVAVNQSLMRLRRLKGKQFLPLEEGLPVFENGIRTEAVADWSRLPKDLFARKEFLDFFGACVERLPEDLKGAYLLKDREGLPEEAVCEILGLTKAAMKNRVHRARLLLKKELEKKYVR